MNVSPELLRAWERRYGLLEPMRSVGGFRLYSEADEKRVRVMQRHLGRGLSAAQAAEAAQTAEAAEVMPSDANSQAVPPLPESRAMLLAALESYDEATAHAVFDRLLAAFAADTVLSDVLLPLLRSLGDRWEAGEVTIAQEHFASNLLRGRLLGLARGWGRGAGPVAVLASPPGEQHDLPLLIFGIALRESGWRIAFLGANTPIATIEHAAESLDASAVILSAVTPERLDGVEDELTALNTRRPVALGGAGAHPGLATRTGAALLKGDPVSAAARFPPQRRN